MTPLITEHLHLNSNFGFSELFVWLRKSLVFFFLLHLWTVYFYFSMTFSSDNVQLECLCRSKGRRQEVFELLDICVTIGQRSRHHLVFFNNLSMIFILFRRVIFKIFYTMPFLKVKNWRSEELCTYFLNIYWEVLVFHQLGASHVTVEVPWANKRENV